MKHLMTQHPQAELLVVDDNPTNLMLLVEVLKTAGFCNVTALSHPADAIEFVKRSHVDVVLLDQNMPDRTGLELYEQLCFVLAQNPIGLLVTALASDELKAKSEALGMAGFIGKPFDIYYLVNQIDKSLNG